MTRFDPRAFIIIASIAAILCAFVLFIMRRNFPREIRSGINEWAFGCLALTGSAIFGAANHLLPLQFMVMVPNLLLIAGLMLLHVSLRRFCSQRDHFQFQAALLVPIALFLLWTYYDGDNYRVRVAGVSGINLILMLACAHAIFKANIRQFAEYLTACLFLVAASVTLMRFLSLVFFSDDSLKYHNDNTLAQQIYFATLAFSVTSCSLGFLLMMMCRLRRLLEYSAAHDDLSGAYNRTSFFTLLSREFKRSRRNGQPLSVLMLDVDHFKMINDTHGHAAGDRVIRNLAQLITDELRSHDVLCRYGGEEFAVMLPDTALDKAALAAERIRRRFADQAIPGLPPYTLSVGVACIDGDCATAEDLIEHADQALYAAKHNGRNCIMTAPIDPMNAQLHRLKTASA